MASYTIGEAANAAGVTTRAVRLYEAKGLLPPPERTTTGYRVFFDADVELLAFIRQGRSLGLSLDAIGEIVEAAQNGTPCDRTRALLARRVAEIDVTIADLQRLRERITRAQAATGGDAGRCAVIESV